MAVIRILFRKVESLEVLRELGLPHYVVLVARELTRLVDAWCDRVSKVYREREGLLYEVYRKMSRELSVRERIEVLEKAVEETLKLVMPEIRKAASEQCSFMLYVDHTLVVPSDVWCRIVFMAAPRGLPIEHVVRKDIIFEHAVLHDRLYVLTDGLYVYRLEQSLPPALFARVAGKLVYCTTCEERFWVLAEIEL